jgi:hypothetical protein
VAAELEQRPADALAVDYFLYGALAAAERASLPTAVLWHTTFGEFDALNVGLPALNAARAGIGLPPLTTVFEQFRRMDRVLVLTDESFDFAIRPAALPANVRHVGPQLPSGTGPARPHNKPGRPPLVLVSLSTTYQAQEDVLCRVIAALGTLRQRGPRRAPWAGPRAAAGQQRGRHRRRGPRRPGRPGAPAECRSPGGPHQGRHRRGSGRGRIGSARPPPGGQQVRLTVWLAGGTDARNRGHPQHDKPGEYRRTERDQAGDGGYCDQACGLGQERSGGGAEQGGRCLAGEEHGADPAEYLVGNHPLDGGLRLIARYPAVSRDATR